MSATPDEEAEDPAARYTLEEQVGRGSFGVVHRARVAGTKEQVAVKIVDLEADVSELEAVKSEVETMASATACAQLVRYLGCHVVRRRLWIVTEYLGGGSLGDLMAKTNKPLPEACIRGVLSEILKGLAFLHAQRRLHRDVKGKNVLVSIDGSVKLADFGVATRLTDTTTKRRSLIGTPYWMAPEVIEQSRYDGAADVWSVGITAIELATTKPPHSTLHPMKVLFVVPKAASPVLEGEFTAPFKALVARCVAKNADDRPACDVLLRAPWIASCNFEAASKPLLAALVAEAAAAAPPPPPPSSRSPTPSPHTTPAASPHTPRTPNSLASYGLPSLPSVSASPLRLGRSRAFRQVVAPAIAAAARHAIRGGDRRRPAAAALDDLCKALERVDGALEGGKLTAAFAVALADALERHRGSLDLEGLTATNASSPAPPPRESP